MGNRELAFLMSFLIAVGVAFALIFVIPKPDSIGTPHDQLVANRAKWEQLRPAIYTVRIYRGCFCEPWSISAEVGGGKGDVITFNERAPDSPHDDRRYFPRNVDDIFDIIEREYASKAYSINVEFDESLGYPTQVHIDRIKEAVDDELALFVTEFAPRHVG